jgi:hypothetical protein
MQLAFEAADQSAQVAAVVQNGQIVTIVEHYRAF